MSILDKIISFFKKKPKVEDASIAEKSHEAGPSPEPEQRVETPVMESTVVETPEEVPVPEPEAVAEAEVDETGDIATESALTKAITFAEEKLKEKEGKISKAEQDAFQARIDSFKDKVGGDEDAALVGISRLIGAIAKARAPQAPPKNKAAAKKSNPKKAEAEGPPSKKKAAAKKSSPKKAEKEGTTLANSIAFAESRLREKEGEISKAEQDAFQARIDSFKDKVGGDEDAALVGISRLIGAITRS